MISFSTALKMFASCSLAEKMRMVENNERELQQRQQQVQQEQLQQKQQEAQLKAQTEQQKMDLENSMNERDNDTKLTIALLQSNAQQNDDDEPQTTLSKEQLIEKMREFDLTFSLSKEKLAQDKHNAEEDRKLKRAQINSKKAPKK